MWLQSAGNHDESTRYFESSWVISSALSPPLRETTSTNETKVMPKKCRSGKGQGRFKKRVRIDTDSPLAEDHREKNDSDEPLTLGPGFVHFSGDVYLHTSRRPVTCWTKRHIFDLTFQLYGPDKVHYPFRDCDPTGKYTKGCEVEKLRSQIAVRRYLERAGDLKNLTETQIDELEERWNAAVDESRGLAMAKAKGVRVSQRSADGANAEEEKRAEVPEPEPTAEDAPGPPKRGRGRPKKKTVPISWQTRWQIARQKKGSSGSDEVIPGAAVDAEAEPPAEEAAVDCATLMAVVDWRSARMREEMRTMIEKASVDEMKQLAVIYGDALVRSTEITIAQAERVKALEADAVTVGEALEQAVAMKDEIGERVKVLEGDLASTVAVGNKRAKVLNEALDLMKTERDSMKAERDELNAAMVAERDSMKAMKAEFGEHHNADLKYISRMWSKHVKELQAEVAAMKTERDELKVERDSMKSEMVKLAKAWAFDSPLFKDVAPEEKLNADDMESDPFTALWMYTRELVRIAPIWKTGKDKAKAELKKVKAELKKVKAEGNKAGNMWQTLYNDLQAQMAAMVAERDQREIAWRNKCASVHSYAAKEQSALQANVASIKAQRDKLRKREKYLETGHNNTTQRFLAAAAERDAMKAERDEAMKLAERLQDRLRQSEVPEEVPEVPTASPDSRKRKRTSPSVSPAVGVKLEPDFDGTERRGRSILRRILPSWNFTKQG